MGVGDMEFDSKMEVSERIRRMKEFSFTKDELASPMKLLVEEGSSIIRDPLRDEI